MYRATLFVLAAVIAVTLAAGQYYVPRAYYTIDLEGHASDPVPLRRLRRSLMPIPYGYGGSSANANAQAISHGWGDASANANARADSASGGWTPGAGWVLPSAGYKGIYPDIEAHY